MSELAQVMFWPFLACVALVGIHTYLGLHVVERQVIFVDLALAQIAALGASVAILLHWHVEGPEAYWLSLGFTLAGAAVLSLTRLRKPRIPQEAIIGITYAMAAALLMLVLSGSGEGDEHMRHALIGNILLVSPREVAVMTAVYAAVGLFHWVFRSRFLTITRRPEEAFAQGWNVRLWDFLFYASFGVVVTSSVKIAGVLLVFTFLVVPASAALLYCRSVRARLMFGWGFGLAASATGMAASYYADWPTGASVVCLFGAFLLAASALSALRRSSA